MKEQEGEEAGEEATATTGAPRASRLSMGRTGRAVSFHAALAPETRQGALAVFVSGFVAAGRIVKALLVWLCEQRGEDFPSPLLNTWLFMMGKTAAQCAKRDTARKTGRGADQTSRRRFLRSCLRFVFFGSDSAVFLLKSSRLPAADPLCDPPLTHPLPAVKGFPRTKAPLTHPHTHPPTPPRRAANGLTKRGKQPLHSRSPHCIRWCRRLG